MTLRTLASVLAGACLALMPLSLPAAQDGLVLSALPESPADNASVDILKEAYARLGIAIEIEFTQAERGLVRAGEGRIDGVVHRMPGLEQHYSNLIPVPVRINYEEAMVFTRQPPFVIDGWASLRRWRIGIRRGIKFIEQGTERMDVYGATSDEQLFQMLHLDRVEIVVVPRTLGLSAIRQLGIEDVRMLEPPVAHVDLFHYLHQRHAGLVPALTSVLEAMAREGRMTAIRERHIGELLPPLPSPASTPITVVPPAPTPDE